MIVESSISFIFFFFFSSRRRHTRWNCDWSSDVCSSDLAQLVLALIVGEDAQSGGVDGDAHRGERPAGGARHLAADDAGLRSEERRVGKECRSRWSAYH